MQQGVVNGAKIGTQGTNQTEHEHHQLQASVEGRQQDQQTTVQELQNARITFNKMISRVSPATPRFPFPTPASSLPGQARASYPSLLSPFPRQHLYCILLHMTGFEDGDSHVSTRFNSGESADTSHPPAPFPLLFPLLCTSLLLNITLTSKNYCENASVFREKPYLPQEEGGRARERTCASAPRLFATQPSVEAGDAAYCRWSQCREDPVGRLRKNKKENHQHFGGERMGHSLESRPSP